MSVTVSYRCSHLGFYFSFSGLHLFAAKPEETNKNSFKMRSSFGFCGLRIFIAMKLLKRGWDKFMGYGFLGYGELNNFDYFKTYNFKMLSCAGRASYEAFDRA